MESISSIGAKLFLRLMRYNAPYKTYDINLKDIRKDDLVKPGKRMCRGCTVKRVKTLAGFHWHLIPQKLKNNKLIVYFHGGGYVGGMVKQQWTTIAKIALKSGSKVIIPEYPLAPESNYKAVFSMISDSYELILNEYNSNDIIFLGESAGGGLLLSFAMKLRTENKPLPAKLVALSPWVDVSMKNPDAKNLEKVDPMIAVDGLKRAGEMYAKGTDTTDFLVSPLYGNPEGLPPTYIYAGTHDILFPDEKLYAEKLKNAGVETYYFEYPKMIHAWMFLPIAEAKKTIQKIISNLNE